MIHELKIASHWLDRVLSGEKRAEVRKHDRDFQVGDVLVLTETGVEPFMVSMNVGRPAARQARVRILHVLPGSQVDGLDDDYCVLSITSDEGGAS